MNRIVVTIEVSDEHDPTTTDPHDIAAEVIDAWHGERAAGNTDYTMLDSLRSSTGGHGMSDRLIYTLADIDEIEQEDWTNEDTILDLCATVRALQARIDAAAENIQVSDRRLRGR